MDETRGRAERGLPMREAAGLDLMDDELADVALDRPAEAGTFCSRGSGYCPQVEQPSRRDGNAVPSDDEWALSDELLDRRAHPNLACVTLSTGEFSKHADSVDLVDAPPQAGRVSHMGWLPGSPRSS